MTTPTPDLMSFSPPTSPKLSPLSICVPEIVCKHSESAFSTSTISAEFTTSASPASSTSESTPAATSSPAILPWSPLLCTCLSANDSRTQDLRSLYHEHMNSSQTTVQRCSWFIQAKKVQEGYIVRKHELEMKSKVKQELKDLTKQKEKARIAAKRAEGYTCRRCKTAKFDSNTKLHEHIRTRHAKKPKPALQQPISPTPSASPPATPPQSVTSSPPTSPKLLPLSISTPECVRELSESVSPTSTVATPKKPISWAEIASRPIVAPKPSRLPIATPKSVCKPLENARVACPPTPPRTPTPSRPYLTVDDLSRMFAGKPSPFGLQRHQMRSFSPKAPGKSNCGPIQSRITSYFHAVASPASKSAKSEAFGPTQARGNVPRQFTVSPAASPTSFPFRFSKVSRPPPVCRHCQWRSATYWPTSWAMPNASRVGNYGIPMGVHSLTATRFARSRPTLGEY